MAQITPYITERARNSGLALVQILCSRMSYRYYVTVEDQEGSTGIGRSVWWSYQANERDEEPHV